MSRRLVLVRHGRTLANAAGRLISYTDPGLDPLGIAQAERLGASLVHLSQARVVSSPLERAAATARILAKHLGLPAEAIEYDPALVELGFGDFENRSPKEIAEAGQEALYRTWRQGEPPAFPARAETFDDAGRRAGELFDRAVAAGTGDLVVVSHGHLLRILLAVRVLGVGAEKHRRLRLDHGRLAVVEWEGEAPRLAHLNVEELPLRIPKAP